ncbi:hypothetical protein B0T18DRAFT_186601 [Schizothecium vesticola]|uniref:Uncharacterized protein n=1 Tax=Schizothecium vesticola TaxID=314040 RepID=A0AA40K2M8_9PEZI|nr:hypothetical protein B0T18DRAFT_186601 [Schizothecium vesticola]
MVWQGSLGRGKRHGAFMISRRLPRGTLILISKIKFVHGKWHPPGPFPRPRLPSLPGRIAASVVMVVKRGKAGVETGETETGETKTETKTRERQDEEGTLCCCGGRQSQQSSTHISTPLPRPVLQSSIGFPVSARHRRDKLLAGRRPQVPFLEQGPTGWAQPRYRRQRRRSRASKQRTRRLCYPPAAHCDGGTCSGSSSLSGGLDQTLGCVVSDAGADPQRE